MKHGLEVQRGRGNKMIPVNCLNCEGVFMTYPSTVKANKGKFCSKECFHEYKRDTKLCPVCNEAFTKPKWQNAKYCSTECRGKDFIGENNNVNIPGVREKLIGENSHRWKGGRTGIKHNIRSKRKYYWWRTNVFKRDDFTCQLCGGRGIYLEAHHVKTFSQILDDNDITTVEEAEDCEELWFINNGITLCKECHKDLHRGIKK